jgi:putative FmdB family regulatory protein
MPIYEYQCQSCGNKCEIMHRMSEEPSKDCGECGSASLKKLMSAVGFKLKGTGWYETDFKHSGSDKNKDAGSKASGKESSSQEDKKASSSKNDATSKSESVKTGNVAKPSE